jgi:molybdenum storage protein
MPKAGGGSARLLMKRQQPLDVPEVATFRLLPDLNVIKVGATSIIEGEPEPLLALVEEIAKLSKQYQLLISTGGGERHRHALSIGVDLNMPIGVLAVIGASAPSQNALILQALLASEGGIRVPPEHFDEIPVYLASGAIPVTPGMPTYNYWEHPPTEGQLPAHDTDVGAYLVAETFGARTVIFAKDVDGVYTDDPKTDPDATLLTSTTVKELRDLPALPFDPPVLDMLERARTVRELRVINGTKPGQLTAALAGEDVGTIVRAS